VIEKYHLNVGAAGVAFACREAFVSIRWGESMLVMSDRLR